MIKQILAKLNRLKNSVIIDNARSLIFFLLLSLLVTFFTYLCGINPLAVVLLLVMVFYVRKQACLKLQKKYNLLQLTLLFVIFFFISEIVTKEHLPYFYIPFSLIPMLATMLFSSLEISLLLSVVSAAILALLAQSNLYLGTITLISGVSASLLVIGARRRSQIIRAGFFIGLVQALSLFFAQSFHFSSPVLHLQLILNGIVCAVLAAGILPVFEYLFKVVTNISLLELSDFNHPLLRKMILKAPGTYHHSLVVGNMAEQACEVVGGANSLLARIGAYYHDIGKIEKAEYFSENQMPSASKHDELTPSMSKLVIMNHVKEGVELAKHYKINPMIIDFILQHHGTSLVYYFYRRALEKLEQDQVKEEGFRYPGPKPTSKETAIVLLADSVEAACRSVKMPTPSTIEEVVHKIINNKFIDGQLDECDLTLKDLERIASVFIRVLGGIYHPRITYPEKESEPRPSSNGKI